MVKLSVIVPNFNHGKYLKERLDSILGQTYNDFELILLDDCSTDDSDLILNEYARNTHVTCYLRNSVNSGSTFSQWEKGLNMAKGEFIWIAESDDRSDPRFIERILKPLMDNEKVGLAYCQSLNIDEESKITGTWLRHTDNFKTDLFDSDFTICGQEFTERFLLFKNVIPNTSAIIFRRSVYDKSGGVNIRIRYCGDWLMWLKLSLLSDICYISEPLNHFRRHQNSVIYRALNTKHRDRYHLLKSDREMRCKLNQWLKKQNGNFNSILTANNTIIENGDREEAFYYIYEGSLLNSAFYAVKYAFRHNSPKILVEPLRRSLLMIYRKLIKPIRSK